MNQKLREKNRKYYQKNRMRIIKKVKDYQKRTNYPFKYYQKNRSRIIRRVQDYQKRTNYASEKTHEARKRRIIKSKTRYYFPLKGRICEYLLCQKKATEHHHNTDPIKFDEFKYTCHDHHKQMDIVKKGGKNGRK